MLKHIVFEDTYLGHDRLSIFALDITERHLRALVPVDLEIWVVDVRDLVDGNCEPSASYPQSSPLVQHTLVLHADSGDTNCRVGSHLHRSQTSSLVAFLAQL
jgi:hypothetical protein